jgi:hypothetical protein
VATVVTQTLVERDDPAFAKPSKPIGEFYTREQAEERKRVERWHMIDDAGRGWRCVVASPKPVRIIEAEVVKHLVKDGYVVLAAGGGGIPVVADAQGLLSGGAAVIDKAVRTFPFAVPNGDAASPAPSATRASQPLVPRLRVSIESFRLSSRRGETEFKRPRIIGRRVEIEFQAGVGAVTGGGFQ